MLKLLFSPKIQLLISLVLAIAAFVVFGYWAISLADASEQVTVVAAAKDLSAPAILTAEDLKLIRIRRDSVPKNAVADLPKAVGLTLTHTVSLNQILTLNELVAKLNPDLAGLTVPGDLKGFTLTNAWLASPLPKIKKDDTLMIIISTPGRDGNRNTGILAQRVPVLATVSASDGSVQQVLLGLDVPTSIQLLQARVNNFFIQVLIDGLAPPLYPVPTSTPPTDD